MEASKPVSIVIPCRNEAQFIGRCLDSILKQTYPGELITVWVCDGMSDDGTVDIINEYASSNRGIRLVENPDRFTPQALNLGIESSDDEVKIILGAHSELDPDYVALCVNDLAKKPEVGCVGGVVDSKYEDDRSELIGKAMTSPFGVGNAHFRTGGGSGYVDTVAFGAYRDKVFKDVGLFDEDLVRNQDDEFNFRVTQGGWKIWLNPEIRASYYARSTIPRLVKQFYQYGYWKVFVNKKHKQVTSVRQVFPPLFVIAMIAGLALAIFLPVWRLVFVAVAVIYFFSGLFFAIRKDGRMTQSVNMVGIFLLMHLAYGTGYLKGIVDFNILRKGPSRKSVEMSR